MNSYRLVGMVLFSTLASLVNANTLISSAAAATYAPKDMMIRNEDARRVNDFENKAKLTTGTEGAGGEKIKEFTIWRKVQADKVHNSTLTRFHTPAEVRNEGILIVENASSRNDVLMYLPNFKKVRRVESQQQSGSFMGSVFSYSDIATPHVEDYTYKLLKEEPCPGAEAKGVTCSVIECLPSNDDIKERTGYSKSILWVRQDNFMSVHAEYYNLEGELYKKLDASEVKIVDAKNKKWLAHNVYITNTKTKEYTRLQFSNVKVNNGISDSIFTQQNLQKVN
jgi:outer membrane lipoprotein-sorting protein